MKMKPGLLLIGMLATLLSFTFPYTADAKKGMCGCYNLRAMCAKLGGKPQGFASHGLFCVINKQPAHAVGTLSYRMNSFPADCAMFYKKMKSNLGKLVKQKNLTCDSLAGKVWRAAAQFSPRNPNGVWSYGYGTVGGQFTVFAKKSRSKQVLWWANGKSWHGVYKNTGKKPQSMSAGLIAKPGELVLHPGNTKDHLTMVRFTAPANGSYQFQARWTNIDRQAKKTWCWVYTNAKSTRGKVYSFTPKGFKEIHTRGITGYNRSVSWGRTLKLRKGEVLSFEVGNGGDSYRDDSVRLQLTVTKK